MNINQACPRMGEMLHSLFPFRGANILLALACLLAGATVAVAQTSLPNARVGIGYGFQVTITPAAPAGTVYGATGLPVGLSINASSGLISGTPIAAGTYNGTISLTEGGITDNFSVVLVVDPALGTPAITSPTATSGTAGTAISTYAVTASNSPTSFNIGTLPPGLTLGGTTTAPTISGTPTTAGTYPIPLSANNAIGTGATTTLTITIAPAGPVPAITSATTATIELNAAFTYTITASNSPVSFSAIGLPLGLSVNATTGAITGTPTVAGVYHVALSATNIHGIGPGTNLSLAVGPVAVITSAASVSANVGSSFSFPLMASNSPLSFNVSDLPAGLSVDSSTGLISGTPTAAGTFTVNVSANNTLGAGVNSTFTLTVAAATSRLMNLSARAVAAGGDQTLIVGLTVGGTGSKQALVRGIGPTLVQFDIGNPLADPRLTLFNSGFLLINQNDDWEGDASLTAAFERTGAFALPPASKDAVLLPTLASGGYTAHVSGVPSGVALLEVYDAEIGNSTARLTNLSARSQVGTGEEVLIAGFVIAGTAPKTLLIRGIGPGLTQHGVSGALADPQLVVVDSSGAIVAQNNDWAGDATLSSAFTQTGAFALDPTSKDAAVVVTLPPGAYTVQVSGVSGTTGVGLVEIYDLQ